MFDPEDADDNDQEPIDPREIRFKLPSNRMKTIVENKYVPDPPTEQYISKTHVQFEAALKQLINSDSHLPMPQAMRNLSRAGLLFMKSLAANPAVIVKPADKGLGLTVLNRSWYDTELARQLSDQTTYRTAVGLRKKLQPAIKKIAGTARDLGMMSDKQHQFVCNKWSDQTSQLPNLYLLPKLHKLPLTGRPIVSSHSYITTPASVWLDYFLQPLVRQYIPTVLTDSRQLVNRIESTTITDPHCTLTTADVNSLYPSIPIVAGIAAVRTFLETICNITDPKQVSVICDLLELVLKNNYFRANGITYKQLQGTAMGTPCAVVLANIYMFMEFDRPLRVSLGAAVLLYGRFIDDIVIITSHLAVDTLHHTMATTNPAVTLTITSSPRRCEFLDLVIRKGHDSIRRECWIYRYTKRHSTCTYTSLGVHSTPAL